MIKHVKYSVSVQHIGFVKFFFKYMFYLLNNHHTDVRMGDTAADQSAALIFLSDPKIKVATDCSFPGQTAEILATKRYLDSDSWLG